MKYVTPTVLICFFFVYLIIINYVSFINLITLLCYSWSFNRFLFKSVLKKYS